jgi:hypothetical protein
MDERVFGPYYGTPPETRWRGPRQRLLATRGPRTRRPRDRT